MCILRILLDAKFVRHRHEREEMESEIVNEIENKFYDDNEQDEKTTQMSIYLPLSTNAIKMTNLCRNRNIVSNL